MVLQCSKQGDIGSFSEMTIEIGSISKVLEEEVRNQTKFENQRVLLPVHRTRQDHMSINFYPGQFTCLRWVCPRAAPR